MLFFGAWDPKYDFQFFCAFGLLPDIFFKRKNSVCGRKKLYASDPAQAHFADKEPETQSFRFYLWTMYFFTLNQTSISDVSGNGIEDN